MQSNVARVNKKYSFQKSACKYFYEVEPWPAEAAAQGQNNQLTILS
jgi:hypothetical protein